MQSYDDLLRRVEQLAPGFGGMFIESDGRLTVYLVDRAQLPAARAAIAAVFGWGMIPAAGVCATAGQYTVSQLALWAEQAAPAWELAGVTLVDLDEARNRVAIGVDHSAKVQAIHQLLLFLNVPAAAVVIDVTEPIRPVQSMNQSFLAARVGL